MKMSSSHFFIFAGETSGDLHGSHLMAALQQRMPHAAFSGVGGPFMRAKGMEIVLPMENFQVMGLTDVLYALPTLLRQFHQVSKTILSSKPAGVILIDYPGFNLRLAKMLRKKGYTGKIIHYISPSVWAHGKQRIAAMAATLDLLLSIFPFEIPYFAGSGLHVAYVGNPLCEYIHNYAYDETWKEKLSIPSETPLLSLFPGSRAGEIQRNLPTMLQATKKIPNITLAISSASPENESLIRNLALHQGFHDVPLVPRKYSYELMRDSHSAIAKSGTVTLELALHECPTAVMYQVSGLNRFFAKYILRLNLPHYCLVNILKGERVFPEMIADRFDADMLHTYVQVLHEEGLARERCKQGCREVKGLLQGYKASEVAAEKIEELFRC